MNVDDKARAPLSASSTCEGSIESHKQSDAMSVDNLPENGHSSSAVASGAAVAEEQVVSRSKPNYRAKFILSGHTMSISSLKFSADGRLLASSGAFTASVQVELSDGIFYRRKPPTS